MKFKFCLEVEVALEGSRLEQYRQHTHHQEDLLNGIRSHLLAHPIPAARSIRIGTRFYDWTAAERAQLAAVYPERDPNEFHDAPVELLLRVRELEKERDQLVHQLAIHRVTMQELRKEYQRACKNGQLSCSFIQGLQRHLTEFLADSSQRPRRWDATVDVWCFIHGLFSEYVQDCTELDSLGTHEELPVVQSLLPRIQRLIDNDFALLAEEEAEHAACWAAVEQILPSLWMS